METSLSFNKKGAALLPFKARGSGNASMMMMAHYVMNISALH